MSFINRDVLGGKPYAPGYFLAENENCERKTRTISQDHGQAVTEGATKHVPGGAIWPSNDANAVGIVYEDVDVTYGDMPGSVVLRGTVYENRLAFSESSYDAVTVGDFVSPKAQGWYESDGQVTPTYTLSTDTKASGAKTYYAKTDDTYSAVTVGDFVSPAGNGWYESNGQLPPEYTLSTDTTASGLKTYYARTDVTISSAAKSALEGLGFKFVEEPSVTRPF